MFRREPHLILTEADESQYQFISVFPAFVIEIGPFTVYIFALARFQLFEEHLYYVFYVEWGRGSIVLKSLVGAASHAVRAKDLPPKTQAWQSVCGDDNGAERRIICLKPLCCADFVEALVTFAMFPTLVTISWLANKGKIEFLALEKKWGSLELQGVDVWKK